MTSALDAWNGNRTKHPGDWRAPFGCIVYYTSTSSYGHAALSLGDGRIVSNNVNGKIGIMNINAVRGYLGWAQFDG